MPSYFLPPLSSPSIHHTPHYPPFCVILNFFYVSSVFRHPLPLLLLLFIIYYIFFPFSGTLLPHLFSTSLPLSPSSPLYMSSSSTPYSFQSPASPRSSSCVSWMRGLGRDWSFRVECGGVCFVFIGMFGLIRCAFGKSMLSVCDWPLATWAGVRALFFIYLTGWLSSFTRSFFFFFHQLFIQT